MILGLGGAVAFSPALRNSVASAPSTTVFSSMGANDFFSKKAASVPARSRTLESLHKNDAVLDPDYTLTWSMALLGALIMWYTPGMFRRLVVSSACLFDIHRVGFCTRRGSFVFRWSIRCRAAGFLALTASLSGTKGVDGGPSLVGVTGGLFHMLFATLLWVQTRRVRCVFEKDSFEFYNIKGPKLDLNNGAKLVQKPDNYVSGTINRWKYNTITNYGFFPSLDFPVICYFKETETPEVRSRSSALQVAVFDYFNTLVTSMANRSSGTSGLLRLIPMGEDSPISFQVFAVPANSRSKWSFAALLARVFRC